MDSAQHWLYLVAYRPGPRWEDSKPRREQTGRDAHAAFMDELAEQGVVLLGGPLEGIARCSSCSTRMRMASREQLVADPWDGDVLTIEYIEPWALWLHHPKASA